MSKITLDANSAVAKIAYKLSEVIPIYPITPSSPMAEYASKMTYNCEKNLFGENVEMSELESEAGVGGTLHGALLGGALSCTFTCSQGLLLMYPNMFKIAGEGLPAVIHVSARAIASHALSIFGDHSDVMAVKSSGFSMIASSNVQEAHDMAAISHICANKYGMPILHFFDGFRTSHEYQKIEEISNQTLKKLFPKLSDIEIKKHPLSPDNPKMFGTAQNPDVFFQNKEASSVKYTDFVDKIESEFDNFYKETGRKYSVFEYYGNKKAKSVIVSMCSCGETIKETIDCLKSDIGFINVRVYRPFDEKKFLSCLPKNVKTICVLEKLKENGANSPLFEDISSAIQKAGLKTNIISGRYGIGGKDFSPKCVKAVIDNLNSKKPKNNFSVGIEDDVLNSSLPLPNYNNQLGQQEIKVFGLGSDGSISASKSLIRILGNKTDKYVQGFYEYDSKKAGNLTISHLRLSEHSIRSAYLLEQSNTILINNFSFVHRYNCLDGLKNNGIVLINSIFTADEINSILPDDYKQILKEKNAKLFVINAQKIAKENGLNEKINIIMQAGLFKVANLINLSTAKAEMKKEIEATFAKKGAEVVEKNIKAMEIAFKSVEEVNVNNLTYKHKNNIEQKSNSTEDIVRKIQRLEGNTLPVSAFSKNGSIDTDTAKFEKRGIAMNLPLWLPDNCIQCGQCVLACPHGALRAILIDDKDAPKEIPFKDAIGMKGHKFRIELSPEDCTGCGVCAKNCPAMKKALEMTIASKIMEKEKENYSKTQHIASKTAFNDDFPKGLQFKKSYFKFSGACAGCGETPYIKLASMLFGDKMIIANATGCSSIYSGSFPYCPFEKDESGKGPAWANSLFEDNAEFGYGLKLGGKYAKQENKSLWIIGGDGWANDIGFNGIDHILQSKENVNILVLDNENYSNTGGQSSKSTPLGAITKFNECGKSTRKKNLGLIAMTYKNAYVAQVALGANMAQCIKAFKEAESYNGPSIIICYSPCVEHGFDMSNTMEEMKKAVECGYWNLYRYNPKSGLTLDYEPTVNTKTFTSGERRFIKDKNSKLLQENNNQAKENLALLKKLSK